MLSHPDCRAFLTLIAAHHVAENRVGSNAATIEIEIGGAIVRVGVAFLGEVIGLLKAAG